MRALIAMMWSLNLMAQIPTIEGKYSQKSCSKFEVSNDVTQVYLVTEIEKSNSFIITKKDTGFVIDGNTDYWNVAPVVYTKSGYYGDDEVNITQFNGNDSAFVVKMKVVSGYGANKNKDRLEIAMKKNIDESVTMTLVSHYKNILTLGFWKKSADIECTFRY